MNKKESFALGISLVSIFLLGFIFFQGLNSDVVIKLENGKTLNPKVPSNFSVLNTVILMILTAITTYCLSYFASDVSKKVSLSRKQKLRVNLLDGDEKKLYLFILERGEVLQKDLIYELGFAKAKVTRILDKLEKKDILTRVSYGKTNKIVAKD